MRVAFFDPSLGALREFRPSSPSSVGVEPPSGGPRERAVHAALGDALRFLGLEPVAGSEIRVGGDAPAPPAAWLKVAAAPGFPDASALKARGFSDADARYLLLRTHYRMPFAFDWDKLAAARRELSDLRGRARALADVGQEPSPRARVGYLHRFREALARDLDLPDALDCVWDALRPGALSPGSKAALLREALPSLGISL